MPTIFVSDVALAVGVVPHDTNNDGFDTLGLAQLLLNPNPTYNPATRTYSEPEFVGKLGNITAGMFCGVTGGTGWTPGLYELEAVDDAAGSITFKAATGVNVSTADAPDVSGGPLATLAAGIAKIPGTPLAPFTSHAGSAAVRLALANSTGALELSAPWSFSIYGTAAFHNKICGATTGGVISAVAPPPLTIRPKSDYTTGPLFQLQTGTNPYYLDLENLAFNGNANSKTATYCVDMATANGNVTVSNCRFTASTNSGLRATARRLHLTRCLSFSCLSHGFELTGSALNDIRVVNCEAYSNTNDGFNVSGTSEGTALIECIAHNNTRHGIRCEGSNRSALLYRCVSVANAQHGFDLAAASDLHVIGCVSAGNGTTSSHRQFSFGTTTHGTRALVFEANAAFAAGSTVATDATDTAADQLVVLTSQPIRNTAAATFDARLTGSARSRLRSLVRRRRGGNGVLTDTPGLCSFVAAGGGSASLVGTI